jgi:hypothetical protein
MLTETQVVAPGEIENGLRIDQRLSPLHAFRGSEKGTLDAEHGPDLLMLPDHLVGRQIREGSCRGCASRLAAHPI